MSFEIVARRARVADIVAVAARMADLPPGAITGQSRETQLTRARQACYVVAYRCGHSLSQVGRLMGGRDHSTIIHGLKAAAVYAERDPAYGEFIEKLESDVLSLPSEEPVEPVVVNAIPDKIELPDPSLVLVRKAPKPKPPAKPKDTWQIFCEKMAAGSAALAAAIHEARA